MDDRRGGLWGGGRVSFRSRAEGGGLLGTLLLLGKEGQKNERRELSRKNTPKLGGLCEEDGIRPGISKVLYKPFNGGGGKTVLRGPH